jgi:N-glycosidase YbiA
MNAIKFYSETGEYGEFSNFAPYPVKLDGKVWRTAEHYFQAQKYAGTARAEEIRKARSPGIAARMGRDRSHKPRRDWESVKCGVTYAAVKAKFTQHAELRAPIISGCPDVLGRVDLVALEADAVVITDFKTSRSAWSVDKVQEAAPQQMLYVELVRPIAKALGNRPIRVEWVVITKTKQPAVERHTLTPDVPAITRTKAIVRHVWQAIAAGHFYPCPSAMNCASCPFAEACRAWEGQPLPPAHGAG